MAQRRVKAPLEELGELMARSAKGLIAGLWRLVSAALGRSSERQTQAEAQLGDYARGARWYADLLGRRRLLLEADATSRRRIGVESSPLIRLPRAEDVDLVSPVPFREAIESVLEHEPRLVTSGSDRDVARAHSRPVGFELARSMRLSITERVQREIAEGMRLGRSRDEVMDTILAAPARERATEGVFAWTRAYADTVWRTNVASAHAAGRFRMLENPAVAAVVGGLRYVAVLDSDVRPNHRAADGLIARANDPVWNILSPPLGFNCLPGDVLVRGAFVAGTHAFYRGDLIEIETRHGRRLSATINHPVLTPDGWLAMHELREGQHLISYRADLESFGCADLPLAMPAAAGRAIDDEDMPARIQDVFDALATHGARSSRTVRAWALPLDFHGDARCIDGEIDVVGTDRTLRSNADAAGDERIEKFSLMFGFDATRNPVHSLRDTNALIPCARTPRAIPGRGALAFDNLPVIGSALEEPPFQPLRRGASADRHACLEQHTASHSAADRMLFGKLLLADPGLVCVDEVVTVRRRPWSGHVYDLQSTTGWMIAAGIIVSNCRCTLELVPASEARNVSDRVRPPPGAHPDQGFGARGRPDRSIYLTRSS